jgi:hypothetical protein
VRSSSIDDQLIDDSITLAEYIEGELLNQIPLNSFEYEILYKAQVVLSRWRSKCEEMRLGSSS